LLGIHSAVLLWENVVLGDSERKITAG
jgi:hypothetical protein